MLETPSSIDKAEFDYSEISYMNHELPSAKSLLTLDFLDRNIAIFRLFRKALYLYLVSSKYMDSVLGI